MRLRRFVVGLVAALVVPAIVAAACSPDPAYSPSPVLSWAALADPAIDAYRLYYRHLGEIIFRPLVDLPCQYTTDDETGETTRWCRGDALGEPVQRDIPDELVTAEFCVRSLAAGLESVDCSNVVSVCMPEIWHGGAYR